RTRRAHRSGRELRLLHRRNLSAVARAARSPRRAAGRIRRSDAHRSVAPRHARPARPRGLRLDRGRCREPDAARARLARQGLQTVHRGIARPADPREALGAVRAGQSDHDRGRRPRDHRALARGIAAAWRVGQRAGAAVPLSWLTRIPPHVGAPRRRRMGARPGLLPRSLRELQRYPGGASAPSGRVGTRHRVMHGAGKPQATVLMTVDAVGGVWSYALTLCAALPGVRFVLALMGPAASVAQRAAAARLGNVVLEEAPYRLEWMDGAAAD